MKEFKSCKSFKPTNNPLYCGDPNREMTLDGLCLKDQQRHDFDDCCDKFEEKERNYNKLL